MIFDFSHFPTLETQRLLLREMTPDDVTALLRHFGNPEVVRFLNMKPIRTDEQAEEWLKWMGGFFAARDGLRWGIILHETGELIGSAGLHNWDREARYAELGYDIARPYWGHGYATEVSRALIQFGWEHMNLHRIEADVVEGNSASMRVLEKLGFRREGVWRQRMFKNGCYHDVCIYGLLRDEYVTQDDEDTCEL